MFRGWTIAELDNLRVNKNHLIQPCIWSYSGDKNSFNQIVSKEQIQNTLINFEGIWVASAYRGCFCPSNTYIDHELRMLNHFNWIDFYKRCIFKEKIKGIILTGWSRYTHETVLSELLCMSIPSLTLCLAVVNKQQLNFNVIF